MKNVLIATVILLLQNSAWAGPSVGGGGDVIILPDDSVVLADPFIDSGAPQPNNMPPLRAMNPRILQVINLYNKASTYLIEDFATKGSDINKALAKLATRNNDLRFYGVQSQEELNQFCAPGGRKIYKLPNGAQVQQVACTAGNETFIVEPLFVRLSLRDQGLLLIHERLTTLRDQFGGKNYSAIARFTTGLNLYLSLYSEQIKKKYRQLNDVEQKLLSDFFVAIEEIEKRNSEVTDDSFQWGAHKNGGGRIHVAAIVDESSFVSLDSVIAKGSEINANAIIKSFPNPYRLPLVMEENTKINNLGTTFYVDPKNPQYNVIPTATSKIILKSGVVLDDVTLGNNISGFTFGEQTEVTNTTINSGAFNSGRNVKLTGANLGSDSIKISDDVSVLNSSLYAKRLQVDLKSSLEQITAGTDRMIESLQFGANNKLFEVKFEGTSVVVGASNTLEASSFNLSNGSLSTAANVVVKGSNVTADHMSIGAQAMMSEVQIKAGTATLGQNNKIELSNFYTSGTLNTLTNVTVKGSTIEAKSFEIGTQTSIEDSSIDVKVMKLGSRVEFRDAKINHRELWTSVANDEKLISNGVYASTYETYFPYGFVPKPLEISWNVDQFRCVYNDKPHKKSEPFRKEFLNAHKDGVIITATSLYQGKVAPFEQAWNYDILDMKVKVVFKNFTRGTDKNLLMISDEGKFVNPDYKRETLNTDVGELPECMRSAIQSRIPKLYKNSGTVISVASGVDYE